MSWRDAPLYVEAHDVARWVLERMRDAERRGPEPLAPRIVDTACDLVSAVSLALTFPATRPAYLEAADVALVRLRTLLRLARDVGLVSPGGLRFAAGRLAMVGRMVGGWRKRVADGSAASPSPEKEPNAFQGDGPQAARGG